MTRKADPRNAFDYPDLGDDLWVFWCSRDYSVKWPDPRRDVRYLTEHKRHIINGSALFTDNASSAKTFKTKSEAYKWFDIEHDKRGHDYFVELTTVKELKERMGYTITESV